MTAHLPARHRVSIAVALAMICGACATPPANEPAAPASPPATESAVPPRSAPPPEARPAAPREKSRAEQNFDRGVRSYEDGDYKTAERQLQAALSLGLPAFPDQATAHKLLAFIACASGRQRACHDEFRRAFDANATFNLTPAEAGHPVWGPVFRSVKAEMAKAPPK